MYFPQQNFAEEVCNAVHSSNKLSNLWGQPAVVSFCFIVAPWSFGISNWNSYALTCFINYTPCRVFKMLTRCIGIYYVFVFYASFRHTSFPALFSVHLISSEDICISIPLKIPVCTWDLMIRPLSLWFEVALTTKWFVVKAKTIAYCVVVAPNLDLLIP